VQSPQVAAKKFVKVNAFFAMVFICCFKTWERDKNYRFEKQIRAETGKSKG
jgi:hypothetical protein